MHNFKTHFSPPLNHYSNKQTVNQMAAVGLMCRLLSDNVSSLLLSLTPKLYWLPLMSYYIICNTTQFVSNSTLLFTLPTMLCMAQGEKIVCLVSKLK